MNVVLVVGIGEFLGFVVGDFREDEGGEAGSCRGGGCRVLGQNGSAVGYAGAVRKCGLAG